MNPIAAFALVVILASGIQHAEVGAADATPAAPTLADAHRYFDSLVSGNEVTALYETIAKNGDFIGYESFPVSTYHWTACKSGLTLKNGVKVDLDWGVVGKPQSGDNSLSIIRGSEVLYRMLHMISVEGGIVVEPSNNIPKLVLAISEQLSRDRLLKAVDLLATTCRSKSKFD